MSGEIIIDLEENDKCGACNRRQGRLQNSVTDVLEHMEIAKESKMQSDYLYLSSYEFRHTYRSDSPLFVTILQA
jgi:hypothetical protein